MKLPIRLTKKVIIKGEMEDWRVLHRLLTMKGLSRSRKSWNNYDIAFSKHGVGGCSASFFISGNYWSTKITLIFYPIFNEQSLDASEIVIERVLSIVKNPKIEITYHHSDYYIDGMLTDDTYFFDMWSMFDDIGDGINE